MEFFAASLVVLGRGLPEKSRNPDLPLSGRLIFLYSLSRFYLPLLLTWIATYSLLFLGVVISKWELPYSSLLTLFEKESSDARQILNNFIQLGIFHLLPAIVLKLQFSAVSDSIESQKTLPNYRDNHLYWAGIVVAVLLLLLAALFPFPFYTGEELYDLPYDRPFLGCLAVLISVIVAGAVYPIISAIANCTIRAPKKWHYLFSSPYIWLFLFSIFNFYLLLPITTFSLPSSYENLAVDKKLQHYAKEAKGNVLDDQSSHLILAGHEGSPEKFIIKEMKDSGMVKNDDLLELCREKRYHYIIKYKEFYGVECLSQLIKFVDKQSGKPKSTSKSFPSKLNRISFQINQCFANAEDQASRYALVIIDKVKKRLDLNPHILTVFERLETQIGSNYQVYYDSMDDDPFKSCLLQDYKLIEVLPAVKGSTFIFRYPVVWLVYEKQ